MTTPHDDLTDFQRRLAQSIAPLSAQDQRFVLEWINRALALHLAALEAGRALIDMDDPDDVDAGLARGLLEGWLEITGVRDGEVVFRLNERGRAEADRRFGRPRLLVDGPKGPQ